jgi:LysR family hydrogen peroxide-inducible transcriptional activator
VAEEDEPSGPFRLGVIPTLSPTVLPLFLADFIASYPRVELVIEELQTEEMIARLHADTLDAAIAATPLAVAGLKEALLGREVMLAYLPPESALLSKKTVSQKDLAPLNIWVMPEGHCFRSQVLSYCQAKRRTARGHVHFESGSFETLIRLVDAGLGATVLPALVVDGLSPSRKRAQVRPLVSPTPVREIGLVTARSELRRQVTSALVDLVRTRLEAALGETPKRVQVLAPTE